MAAVCLLAAVALLAGCGGGGGGTAPGLTETRAMTATGVQDDYPIGNDTLQAIDEETGTSSEDMMLDDVTSMSRGMMMTWDHNGMHFEVTADGDLNTMTWQHTVHVTGTTPAGVTVDITRTMIWDKSTNTRTVTVTGTVVKDGATYTIDIRRVWSVSGTVRTLTVDSTMQKDGAVVYDKHITRTLDTADTAPRPRTMNGTITVHDPQDPSRAVTLTFTDLVYTVNMGDAMHPYRVFVSGTLDIATSWGVTAHLTAADGALSGPILDGTGQQIGTMTIANGEVTVVQP